MNTVTVSEPRTAAVLAARSRKTEAALDRVRQAIAYPPEWRHKNIARTVEGEAWP